MKKVLFFAVALVAACTMTSCKKTCTCKFAATGTTQEVDLSSSQYENLQNCKDLQNYMSGGGVINVTCK